MAPITWALKQDGRAMLRAPPLPSTDQWLVSGRPAAQRADGRPRDVYGQRSVAIVWAATAQARRQRSVTLTNCGRVSTPWVWFGRAPYCIAPIGGGRHLGVRRRQK